MVTFSLDTWHIQLLTSIHNWTPPFQPIPSFCLPDFNGYLPVLTDAFQFADVDKILGSALDP